MDFLLYLKKPEILQLILTKLIQGIAMNSGTDVTIQGFGESATVSILIQDFYYFWCISVLGKSKADKTLVKWCGKKAPEFC